MKLFKILLIPLLVLASMVDAGTVSLKLDSTTGVPVNPPLAIPRGSTHEVHLAFRSAGVNTLRPVDTAITLELFDPADLVTPLTGTTVSLWSRNTGANDYTANIDMTVAAVTVLNSSTIYGRVRYTEPEQSEVVGPVFHVLLGAGASSGAGNESPAITWEQITNPPAFVIGSADIVDATDVGQALVTATDSQTARAAIAAHDAAKLSAGRVSPYRLPVELPINSYGFISGSEIYTYAGGAFTAITADAAAKRNLQESGSAYKYDSNGTAMRVAKTGKGPRPVYEPADLNHIIFYGQSNAVGYNAGQGNLISTTQPYRNVMFSPLTIRRYYNSGNPTTQTDSSVLVYEDFAGSGLRGPWSQVLTATLAGGGTTFWAPGGENTAALDHYYYKTQLDTATFIPLVESLEPASSPVHSESLASSTLNQLTAMTGYDFIGSIAGIGGMDITNLSAGDTGGVPDGSGQAYRRSVDLSVFSAALTGWYGTGAFANVLAQVERAQELAVAESKTYKVPAIVWVQGESDNSNTGYANSITGLVNSLNTCIKALTGQSEDIVVMIDGITYAGSYGGINTILPVDEQGLIAHLDAAPSGAGMGRIYLAGPRYQYRTSTHYDPQSFASKGTVFAQAIYATVFESQEWEPVRFDYMERSGNDLYMYYHVPTPPLQFDGALANSISDTITGSMPNHGFDVRDSLDASIITGAEIVGPRTVRLICSESPLGGTWSYGDTVSTGTLTRGDLCDSTALDTVAKVSGESLDSRNFAILERGDIAADLTDGLAASPPVNVPQPVDTTGYDADVAAYAAAHFLTDQTRADALNDLVVLLKAESLYATSLIIPFSSALNPSQSSLDTLGGIDVGNATLSGAPARGVDGTTFTASSEWSIADFISGETISIFQLGTLSASFPNYGSVFGQYGAAENRSIKLGKEVVGFNMLRSSDGTATSLEYYTTGTQSYFGVEALLNPIWTSGGGRTLYIDGTLAGVSLKSGYSAVTSHYDTTVDFTGMVGTANGSVRIFLAILGTEPTTTQRNLINAALNAM